MPTVTPKLLPGRAPAVEMTGVTTPIGVWLRMDWYGVGKADVATKMRVTIDAPVVSGLQLGNPTNPLRPNIWLNPTGRGVDPIDGILPYRPRTRLKRPDPKSGYQINVTIGIRTLAAWLSPSHLMDHLRYAIGVEHVSAPAELANDVVLVVIAGADEAHPVDDGAPAAVLEVVEADDRKRDVGIVEARVNAAVEEVGDGVGEEVEEVGFDSEDWEEKKDEEDDRH
ncbi:LOW QUALITY PROTEIN: hypothetical protein OSB04_025869 [Centaurea solstitialis]|uniref:Uncharacterized protein n=1 Tax=Centaurea solstitialis TaxID=347529 RepID=A0AA38T7C1_9ASTR|nr:LOW QUALITY PROTEIN: hypothetical protein OSB04_025869 [Centaurea solstitialis]